MLREYQKKAISDFENSNEKNVVITMPTGSGKTFTFCEIAKRYHAENVKKVLIIVHRFELLNQAYNSLGERCFRIEAGVKQIPTDYDYYVSMVETVSKRIKLLPSFGLVIIDECHINNFKKLPFFTDLNTRVLGVTATPISDPPLATVFKKLIQPITIDKLIEDKFLLNCNAYGFASDLVAGAKFKTKGKDYDEKQMADFYSSEKMVKNVVESYWSKSAGKKTMIFNVNVNHNLAVYEAFKSEGLNVYSLTGETSLNERKEVLKSFKEQSDAILCSVGVLTTGFDEPSVKTIILNRATKSLTLYLQMIGRGSRIYENKNDFLVLDLGKNTTTHGFYNDYFDWQNYFLKGSKKESKGGGATPIKECPTCGFNQHTRKVICENCGHDFVAERELQAKEERTQKLYLLIKERPINTPTEMLFTMAAERGWKPYAVLHKIAEHVLKYENKYDVVDAEYSEGEALIQLDKWCKKYEKKNNKWHKNFIINILNEKRKQI
jgi:superfamily II DNA or RNA helicase